MFWNSAFCALCMLAVFLMASFRVVPFLFGCYKIEPEPRKENLSCKSTRKEVMELIVITMLCISLPILLTPCASLQIQLQPWHEQARDDLISLHLRDAYDLQQHSFSKMPRKLRLIQVKRDGEKDSISQHRNRKGDFSGKPYGKEPGLRHGRDGTMQEWMEGADMSQFFTMDYSNVRRRRPIHNKSLPVGP